jgi:hypothetical protein
VVLDPDTWVTVQAVLKRSSDLGLDVAEQLHRRGLILTPAVERNVKIATIEFILNELRSWRPTEMLRVKFHPNHSASPADMQEAIGEWLTKHIDHLKSQ